MSAVSQGSLTATGQAVRRVLAGILTRRQIEEPTPVDVARLALAAVVLPVWIGLAAAASRHAAGIAIDVAAATATILRLFVLQTLALVPILAALRSFRSVGALGGNGALPDFALVLHLSAGIALGLDAGNPGVGAAAFALQQTVVYVTSVAMVVAAAGRGVVAASPALVAAGVLSALMPPCIVLVARASTALAMHLAEFPASVLASARRIYGLF